MLTRSEMEELLIRQSDMEFQTDPFDEFSAMTDEELRFLFEKVFPDEKIRQEMEKSIRDFSD